MDRQNSNNNNTNKKKDTITFEIDTTPTIFTQDYFCHVLVISCEMFVYQIKMDDRSFFFFWSNVWLFNQKRLDKSDGNFFFA